MSRWNERVENHQFLKTWDSIKSALEKCEITQEHPTNEIEELARFRKVAIYIDTALNQLDYDFLPLQVLNQAQNHASNVNSNFPNYVQHGNFALLQEANNHIDHVLSVLSPYISGMPEVSSIKEASLDAANWVRTYFDGLGSETQKIASEIVTREKQVKANDERIKEITDKLNTVDEKFFADDGLKVRIEDLLSSVESQHAKIKEYYHEIHYGTDEDVSIKQGIKQTKEDIQQSKEEFEATIASVSQQVSELKAFYIKIYGEQVNDEGDRSGGLDHEISLKQERLDDFEESQEARYTALNEQIESLLPGATSAGLATAYKQMKESFDQPIRFANLLFFGSIIALMFSAFLLSIESIGTESAWLTFVSLTDWDTILKSLVYKLPFYGPILWLALFASKRRSEFHRLQQEYAHKEALAKSYQSYKKQIEELNTEDQEMLKHLILKSIDAVAYNASETLDKHHGDKAPVADLADRIINGIKPA